eukprot:sb/3477384/
MHHEVLFHFPKPQRVAVRGGQSYGKTISLSCSSPSLRAKGLIKRPFPIRLKLSCGGSMTSLNNTLFCRYPPAVPIRTGGIIGAGRFAALRYKADCISSVQYGFRKLAY